MCNYDILAHNEDGYLILCQSCRHYQLAFGTMTVTFEPFHFEQFCRQLNGIKNALDCDGFEKQKRYSLDIFCNNARMVLNYIELLKLNSLIGEATFNEEVDQLLEDIKLVRE